MVKNIKKKQPTVKKILKILGIVIAGIVSLVIFLALLVYAYSAVVNKLDSNKFAKLDVKMNALFNKIKTVDSSIKWDYDKYCDEEMAGPWPTGEFNCYLSINTKAEINNIDQLNTYHNQYFPVFDGYEGVKEKAAIEIYPVSFMTDYATGNAVKDYSINYKDVSCRYDINLSQNEKNSQLLSFEENYTSGYRLHNNEGALSVEFLCTGKVNFELYPKSD